MCLLSVVARFLDLVVAQLLHIDSEAPSGLQLHILDLYMTELAAVGSKEVQHRCRFQDILGICYR